MKSTLLITVINILSATSAAPLPSEHSNAIGISHSPAPCGRFIGEMWFPLRRRPDGTCPPSPGYSRPERKSSALHDVQVADGEERSALV